MTFFSFFRMICVSFVRRICLCRRECHLPPRRWWHHCRWHPSLPARRSPPPRRFALPSRLKVESTGSHLVRSTAQYEHVGFDTLGSNRRGDLTRRLARHGVGEFRAHHKAQPTDVADNRVASLHIPQLRHKVLAPRGCPSWDVFLKHRVNRGQRSARDDGVPTSVRSTVCSRLPLGHQFRRRADGRNRHPIAQSFRHYHDVWFDAAVFNGEHFSSPTETRLNLVHDQQNLVLVAEGSKLFHELVRDRNVAALSQDWFDKNCRRLLR